MSKRGSLVHQVEKRLSDAFSFGESKHKIKRAGGMEAAKEGIFAFNTAKTYIRECCEFVKWVKARHPQMKTLEDCKPYIREYLSSARKQNGEEFSAYSLSTKAAAIAKLYGIKKCKTPTRTRAEIRRSRNYIPGEFEKNNPEIVKFCESTGLRRHELETLRGNQLVKAFGNYYIRIIGNQAKGGKPRAAAVIGEIGLVVRLMERAGNDKVFGRISKSFDIHAHRAKYASELYKQLARPLEVCKSEPYFDESRGAWRKNSVYYCRKDQSGKWLDCAAMHKVSKSLGHNRISVIAEHYLYQLD